MHRLQVALGTSRAERGQPRAERWILHQAHSEGLTTFQALGYPCLAPTKIRSYGII